MPRLSARDPEVQFDRLPEAFVQDMWRHCDFDTNSLWTVSGEPVRIRYGGRLNTDGGPDFLHARIQIGDIEWVGDVEIHLTSEDWYRHGHHRDPRYNSVVLHVTLVADLWTGAVAREDGTTAAEVVLSNHLGTKLRKLLHRFRTREESRIICASEWAKTPTDIRSRAIHRMSRLRLLRNAKRIELQLADGTSVREVLYRSIFACLGFAKNEVPMLDLATRVPLALAWELQDHMDLEALYLGMAGFIPEDHEAVGDSESQERVRELAGRFQALPARPGVPKMVRTQWQFFRLRPSNFPPLRIAQGCALIASGILSSRFRFEQEDFLRDASPGSSLHELVGLLKPSVDPFWESHYRLERPSRPHSAQIGIDRIRRIVINALLPTCVASSERAERKSIIRKCLRLLEQLPAENDELTRAFAALGTDLPSASESQGLHELYATRCKQHGCLRCDIGCHILRAANK